MQKKASRQGSRPERYGMVSCPECHGRGKIFKNPKEFEVCMGCGGFGAIKAPAAESVDASSLIRHEH